MPWKEASQVDVGALRLRLLIQGRPKVGKTTAIVKTAPGPVGILLFDDPSALREARRQCADGHYIVQPLKGAPYQEIVNAIGEAKLAAKKGRIKTVVFDVLAECSERMFEQALEDTRVRSTGAENTQRAYPLYERRILKILDLLMEVPCHVICINHYVDPPAKNPDDKEAQKQAIIAADSVEVCMLLTTRARQRAAGKFSDIVFMGYEEDAPKGEERFFLTGPRGAITNAGCRSLPETKTYRANIATLIAKFTAAVAQKAAASKATIATDQAVPQQATAQTRTPAAATTQPAPSATNQPRPQQETNRPGRLATPTKTTTPPSPPQATSHSVPRRVETTTRPNPSDNPARLQSQTRATSHSLSGQATGHAPPRRIDSTNRTATRSPATK